MNMLNYIVEANLGVITCFVLYECLLARETNFKLQRIYLLSGLGASLLFPLFNFRLSPSAIDAFSSVLILPEIVIQPGGGLVSLSTTTSGWTLSGMLWLTYVIGLLALLVPVLVQLFRLLLIRRQQGRYEGRFYVIESSSAEVTYSFFNTIVVGMADRLSEEEKRLVILHEQCHSRMLHTLDVLGATALCIVFWFNPLVWLCRRRLIRIHEYQADRFVSNASSPNTYSLLLARSAMMSNGLTLAHNLNRSFILKRIDMINQLPKRVGSWKLLTVAAAMAVFAVVVACTDQLKESESLATKQDILALAKEKSVPATVQERLKELQDANPDGEYKARQVDPTQLAGVLSNETQSLEGLMRTEEQGWWAIIDIQQATQPDRKTDVRADKSMREIVTNVDETASPIGGFDEYYRRLAQVLTYPDEARQQGIEGNVKVEFVVQRDGRMTDFKVLQGLGAGCDAAAVAAIMETTGWVPAKHEGQIVAQRMVLPVTFMLN